MSEPKERPAFRIAFRAEGDFVNAYFAKPDTMDDALLVSSIRRSMLEGDGPLWDAWRALMRTAFEAHFRTLGFGAHEWKDLRAPEHERTGEA